MNRWFFLSSVNVVFRSFALLMHAAEYPRGPMLSGLTARRSVCLLLWLLLSAIFRRVWTRNPRQSDTKQHTKRSVCCNCRVALRASVRQRSDRQQES